VAKKKSPQAIPLESIAVSDATFHALQEDANLDYRLKRALLGEIQKLAVPAKEAKDAALNGMAQRVSKQNSANAGRKGAIWRRAAIEQWAERRDAFKSLREFCATFAEHKLVTEDGEAQEAPEFRQFYRVMCNARKAGELKP
jgi:hypothetical protein